MTRDAPLSVRSEQDRAADDRAVRRGARRRAWLGLQTLLGLARRGYFIPHRHADQTVAPGRRPAYAAVEALFEARRPAFAALLASLEDWRAPLLAIGEGDAGPAPAARWAQGWFPRLDAAVAYALVRREAPARIVEVGSGHSTRFLLRAIADGGLETRVTAIDPAPRASLETVEGLTLVRRTVQQAGLEPFRALRAGDMLLIDSSHVLMPGSDVDILLGHVVPALPAGVWLHVHDIFLPDDYPASWDWRGYNEQLAVLPLVLGGGWETVFASHYAATRMGDSVAASVAGHLPLWEGAFESGLWLCKTAP